MSGSVRRGRAGRSRCGPTPPGRIALSSGDRELEEAIALVLGTAPGERPMRPEFGCAIHDFVFAPADATTAGRIAYEVRASLDRWEPRIEVTDVDVTFDPATPPRSTSTSATSSGAPTIPATSCSPST